MDPEDYGDAFGGATPTQDEGFPGQATPTQDEDFLGGGLGPSQDDVANMFGAAGPTSPGQAGYFPDLPSGQDLLDSYGGIDAPIGSPLQFSHDSGDNPLENIEIPQAGDSQDSFGQYAPDNTTYSPATPEEFRTDHATYNPLDDGPQSPVAMDTGPASPDDAYGPQSPSDYIQDGPQSPVAEVEYENPQSPTNEYIYTNEAPQSPVEEYIPNQPMSPNAEYFPEGPQSPADGPQSPEGEYTVGPQSPSEYIQHIGEEYFPDNVQLGAEEAVEMASNPASPGSGSPVGSPVKFLVGQESPGSGSHISRSGSFRSNRSRSGTPQSGSPGGSPRSGMGSPRSRSGSPRSVRSGSPGYSGRSRSGTPQSARSGSPRSRSGSPRSRSGSPRSRSGSPRSRSGSPRSRSGSPRSRSGSPRSRSGSPRSRSGSPRSRSGSPRSRSGSPRSRIGSRSRSGSRASRRSGSWSPRSGSPRSRSGSPQSRSRSRSRSGSPRSRSGSPMSNIGSPGSHRSRSGSRSRSRSRSPSRSRSRSRSASPGSGLRSPAGSAASASPGRASDAGSDVEQGKRARIKDSDDEGSEKGSVVGELIADIFGESDEDEEFEGFGAEDVEAHKKKDKAKAVVASDEEEDTSQVLPAISSDDDEETTNALREQQQGQDGDFVSDFDLMLQKKKDEMRKKRRKRKDITIINDNDDLIAAMIQTMKTSAEEDRELNNMKKPAVKKLQMLPKVMSQLKKADLHEAFLECNILGAMTEWLAPLPDKSLPHLKIRESFLQQMLEFPPINTEHLKLSGIGKAVMYLYKHPKEIRHNKMLAGKLVNEWSRPIFNLTANYKTLTREDREQRDYQQLPKKRKLTLEGGQTPQRDIDKALQGEEQALRPGDPGYIMRARVPQPSKKDYVIRPKWNVEEKPTKGSGKKSMDRFERQLKEYKDKKARKKQAQRAVTISIEGRNMNL